MNFSRGDSPMSSKYIYNMTMKMFGSQAEPAFETRGELEASWGREWGCDNDVGDLRLVMMHRPGPEFDVIDPAKRIESIGSFGDLDKGWYFQSDTIPELDQMRFLLGQEKNLCIAQLKTGSL